MQNFSSNGLDLAELDLNLGLVWFWYVITIATTSVSILLHLKPNAEVMQCTVWQALSELDHFYNTQIIHLGELAKTPLNSSSGLDAYNFLGWM